MGAANGLGLLQVGMPRENDVQASLGEGTKGGEEAVEGPRDLLNGFYSPEAEVGGYLVVSRAPGVKFPSNRPHVFSKKPLHEGVDILIRGVREIIFGECLGHPFQPRDEGASFLRGQHARSDEGPSPGLAPPNVLRPEAVIHVQASVQRDHGISHPLTETTAPESFH